MRAHYDVNRAHERVLYARLAGEVLSRSRCQCECGRDAAAVVREAMLPSGRCVATACVLDAVGRTRTEADVRSASLLCTFLVTSERRAPQAARWSRRVREPFGRSESSNGRRVSVVGEYRRASPVTLSLAPPRSADSLDKARQWWSRRANFRRLILKRRRKRRSTATYHRFEHGHRLSRLAGCRWEATPADSGSLADDAVADGLQSPRRIAEPFDCVQLTSNRRGTVF